ncbi:hypothetical protein N7530_011104 [Penicillium desertorum]|uniref:Uncharacterized protein n=1 Tax=Penicillium desertorum TaxID=1303715 RepID=A0A9W9WGI4_9EURO|nr:hypothetical protein N7530_011104 [Penicillium desertorum]
MLGFLTLFLKRWARIQVQTSSRVPLELLTGVNLGSHRARLGIGNIFMKFRKRFHKGPVAAPPLVSRRCYSNKAKEKLSLLQLGIGWFGTKNILNRCRQVRTRTWPGPLHAFHLTVLPETPLSRRRDLQVLPVKTADVVAMASQIKNPFASAPINKSGGLGRRVALVRSTTSNRCSDRRLFHVVDESKHMQTRIDPRNSFEFPP